MVNSEEARIANSHDVQTKGGKQIYSFLEDILTIKNR